MIANAEDLVSKPQSPMLRGLRRDALELLEASLRAVEPERALDAHLRRREDVLEVDGLRWDLTRFEDVRLLSVGKASLPMARAALRRVPARETLVVTSTEETVELPNVTHIQASHPVLNDVCLRAGSEALDMAKRSGPRDLLIVLLSGGGSAMLEVSDLSLESLRETNRLLLRSGMAIAEINTVRKHLSSIKGGQLGKEAARRGGNVLTLALSDVVGDDPSVIASGPTVSDPSTFREAREALERHGVWEAAPQEVRRLLRAGIEGAIAETPKLGDLDLRRSHFRIVGSIADAVRAASEEGRRRGYSTHTHGTELQGEARVVAQDLLSLAISVQEGRGPVGPPALIVAGGETTVTVRGKGSGGRNLELVLAAVRGLAGRPIVFLSADTDGRDGETDAAGALADGETLPRALERKWEPEAFLAESDSYGFFQRLGDAIRTGPTGTNVMDLQLLLIGPPPEDPDRT